MLLPTKVRDVIGRQAQTRKFGGAGVRLRLLMVGTPQQSIQKGPIQKASPAMASLLFLPSDALLAILCRVPAKDQNHLRLTCQAIRALLDSATFRLERSFLFSGWVETQATLLSCFTESIIQVNSKKMVMMKRI
jgi:hypothetical protein